MNRLRSIFDGMFDGVWLVAADGRTTYANGAIAALLGTTRAKMRNRTLMSFVDPVLRTEVERFLARQRTHAGERMELRLRRVDGADLFVMMAGSPLYHDGTFVGTMLNISDVSGKRSIDAQLVQNQRLEAIGEFAGGIAHDFNNLLTSIHGYAELAMASLGDDDPARSDLAEVLASAQRATSITTKLLAFTRRQVLLASDVDPGEVLTGLIPMLRPLLGDGIKLELDIEPDHAWVRVDPTQLEQVLVNLAINARDAMPTGGTVSIGVQNVIPPDPERPDADLTAGPFVRITVSDTGTGMDETIRTRIFDPFYTTKGPGKGTGLGLSTVFGIVAQSGGQISVDTTVGIGSTFHVDLPRVLAAVLPPTEKPEAEARDHVGVVLVVDDDRGVREFARRSLEFAGYTVLVAGSADDATGIAAKWKAGIDVLLSDIVMPGIHGPELARRIRTDRPNIGVVLTSGYAEEAVDLTGELVATGEFLAKPFSVQQVQQAVGRAADWSRDRTLDVPGGGTPADGPPPAIVNRSLLSKAAKAGTRSAE